MEVIVFGASGKVGRLVVAELLKRQYTVTVFVHRHSPFSESRNLRIVTGDIHDKSAVEKAVAGHRVVISALGSWGTAQKDIVSTATRHIIAASTKHDVTRFISVTGADARMKGDRVTIIHWCSHLFISLFARRILHDGEQHIAQLQKSTLNWTALRSPIMTNKVSGKYRLDNKRPFPWMTIPRRAVVSAIIDQIESDAWNRQAPFLHKG